jgi:O-antigen/teichoic acid export membrane protein
MSSMAALGSRISRHATIYLAGHGSTLVVGFLSIGFLTRLMRPSDYGLLAVLLVFATILTVLYNMGSLQGTFFWVYGTADDEDDAAIGEEETGPTASGKREALGTGLTLTATTALAGTLVILAAAPLFSHVVTGSREHAGLVMLAALAGAMGSLWRLVLNVPRVERRPAVFNTLATVRPVAVLGLSVLLVSSGHGVGGALAGVAGGTALPIIIAFWILNQADLLVLSKYVSHDDVALYRVGSRIAALVSYVGSAFMMAWMPLSRTSLVQAVKKERGAPAMNSVLMTYYVLAILALLLALAFLAEVLIEIAPPSYARAAILIPVLAFGLVGHGFYMVIYRVSSFPGRRIAYAVIALTGAAMFNVAALVLVPLFHSYGAAAALVIGNFFCAGVMLFISQHGPRPVPFEYGRMGAAVGLALVCLVVGQGLASVLPEGAAAAVKATTLMAYPLLLIRLRVIPPDHLRPLVRIARSVLPDRAQRTRLEGVLPSLSPEAMASLDVMIARRTGEAAPGSGSPNGAANPAAVEALRQLVGVPAADPDLLEGAVQELCRIRHRSGPLTSRYPALGPTAETDVESTDLLDVDAPALVRPPAR